MSQDEKLLQHQEKWRKWRQKQAKQAMLSKEAKGKIEQNLESYAISLVRKLDMKSQSSNNNKDLYSKKISNQIQSNVCSICLDLMIPPLNNPIILFPCGHNLCKSCLYTDAHLNKKVYTLKIQKCPICRGPIQSHTLNRNLMTLICTYTDNKDLLEKQAQKELQTQQSNDDIEKLRIRCKILQKQKDNFIKQGRAYKKQIGILEEVIATLKQQKKKNEEQREKLQEQGRLINKYLRQKNQEYEKLEKKCKQCQSRQQLIQKTLAPLKFQKQKMELLEVATLLEGQKK